MSDATGEFGKLAATIATALIGVAVVSVIVSKNANTSGVISSGFSGLASVLKAATSPVSGGGSSSGPLSSLGGGIGGLDLGGVLGGAGGLGNIVGGLGGGGGGFDIGSIFNGAGGSLFG